jgi:predicted AlkP superfamily pyrophosphatase or phosphodiesterase
MRAKLFLILFAGLFFGGDAHCLNAETYQQRPRLVITVVIDQFRADYLTQLEKKFLPAGKGGGGFQALMKKGAWFPFASYDNLQNMTGPGHATVLTGAHPFFTGIGNNEWFDPATGKDVYCVDDPKFGRSPSRLRAPTLGDELKLRHPESKVVSLALKDRAAILLGGHAADLALWFDKKTNGWTTSAFYGKGQIPAWATALNQQIASTAGPDPAGSSLLSSFRGTKLTFAAALAALKSEGLGKTKGRTDILALSLSNHDILGHKVGPDDAGMEELTLLEDRELAAFLSAVSRELHGLDDVVVVLTGDHGAPPGPANLEKSKLESGRLDEKEIVALVEQALTKEFGAPEGRPWVLSEFELHFVLNKELAAKRRISAPALENAAKAALSGLSAVEALFTRTEYELGLLPPGLLGEQIRHSYILRQSGDLVLIPRPYFVLGEEGYPVVHMTGWAYDRSVPILFMGRAFKAGVYSGGGVIDIAPTLAFVMGITPPAMSEGQVLGQALK